MEETYPIVIDGKLVGEMKIYKEGMMTVFEADCRMCEGILRLSAYGSGGEGYIGVLAPRGERLCLRKSFSPNAMRAMPSPIELVAAAGLQTVSLKESDSGKEGEPAETWLKDEEKVAAPGSDEIISAAALLPSAEVVFAPQGVPKPEKAQTGEDAAEQKAEMEKLPEKGEGAANTKPLEGMAGALGFAGEGEISEDMLNDVFWYSSPDGALVCFNGERSLIALPEGDARIPGNLEPIKKTIEGKMYFIYITRNGRIVG